MSHKKKIWQGLLLCIPLLSMILCSFIRSLKNIYKNHNGLEAVFSKGQESAMQKNISNSKTFFEVPHQYRTQSTFRTL
jgi:outer membrane lipoprotein-sorting protein